MRCERRGHLQPAGVAQDSYRGRMSSWAAIALVTEKGLHDRWCAPCDPSVRHPTWHSHYSTRSAVSRQDRDQADFSMIPWLSAHVATKVERGPTPVWSRQAPHSYS